MIKNIYLGDGVYAQWVPWDNEGMLILRTRGHREHEAENTICVEPWVLNRLFGALDVWKKNDD